MINKKHLKTVAIPTAATTAALLTALITAPAANAQTWSLSRGAGEVRAGKATLWANGSATTTINGSGKVAIYGKASHCRGAPTVEVLDNGKSLGKVNIVNTSGTWAYAVGSPVKPGAHKITVKFVNNYSTAGCDRNVYIESVGWWRDPSNPFNKAAPALNTAWAKKLETAAALKEKADPRGAAALRLLAGKQTAVWLGDWSPRGKVGGQVAEIVMEANKNNRIPTFVIYGIPNRDCVAGAGLRDKDYWAWIGEVGWGLSKGRSVAILEPDALASIGNCPSLQRNYEKYLKGAVQGLKGKTDLYIDAGHPGWLKPEVIATRLKKVGLTVNSPIRGFALNVANTQTDAANYKYGEQISKLLGGKKYVVDTSRNGLGQIGGTSSWCNPKKAAIGAAPGAVNRGNQDANLWIKAPGESDGTCNGGPNAGVLWEPYAVSLVNNSKWKY